MDTDIEAHARRLYAFLRRESDESPEVLLTEDFSGHLTAGLPLELGGEYDGRADMVERGWGRVARAFDVRPEPDELIPLGDDTIIARGHYVGTARNTGKPLRAAFVHFWSIREGRFASVYQVTDSAAWAHALE